VNGFVHGVFDDIVVSTKLLLAGKAAAWGNIARQAIEGLAMAVLCSADQEVILRAREKQGDVRGRYWERVMDPTDRLVEGQRAVQQLAWNADQLRLPRPWIDRLCDAQKLFSAASHAGPLTIAYRTHLGLADTGSIGGHFDAGKLASYRTGLTLRTFMARDLASVMPDWLDKQEVRLAPFDVWKLELQRVVHFGLLACDLANGIRRNLDLPDSAYLNAWQQHFDVAFATLQREYDRDPADYPLMPEIEARLTSISKPIAGC